MKAFRLIGNDRAFALERTFKSAGCIPAVVGISMDGKRKAIAAESDIIWLDDFRYKPTCAPDALGRYAIHDCDRDDIIDRAHAQRSRNDCDPHEHTRIARAWKGCYNRLMNFSRPLLLATVILIAVALFFLVTKLDKKPGWAAWPEKIIVDSPEEFRHRNTP